MNKRVLAMLLTLMMIISIVPVSAFAAENKSHKHNYVGELTRPSTARTKGVITYTCTGCPKSYSVDFYGPRHNFVKTVVKEATCQEAGLAAWSCTDKNCGLYYNEGIAATGEHDYVVVKELAATCIEPGYVWKECSICGAEKNHEIGEATGEHDYVVVKELAATCIEPGYVWKECSVCGTEKNHEVGEARGEHGAICTDTMLPNCTTPGYTRECCQDCGEIFTETVLPVNDDHAFYNGKCLLCGEEEKPCEHTNTYTDTLEANCSAEGYTKVICRDCGETVSEEILEKNDTHFFYNGACLKCGTSEEIEEEKPCEHNYEVVKRQEADCMYPAYVWEKCTLCGNEKSGEVGEANPNAHNVVNGVCTNGCGYEEETECAHNGGTTTTTEGFACTGYTNVTTCNGCGEELNRTSEEAVPHLMIPQQPECLYGCGTPNPAYAG